MQKTLKTIFTHSVEIEWISNQDASYLIRYSKWFAHWLVIILTRYVHDAIIIAFVLNQIKSNHVLLLFKQYELLFWVTIVLFRVSVSIILSFHNHSAVWKDEIHFCINIRMALNRFHLIAAIIIVYFSRYRINWQLTRTSRIIILRNIKLCNGYNKVKIKLVHKLELNMHRW